MAETFLLADSASLEDCKRVARMSSPGGSQRVDARRLRLKTSSP